MDQKITVTFTTDELARTVKSLSVTCDSLLNRAKRTTGARHREYLAERGRVSALQMRLQAQLDLALAAA